MQHFGPMLHRLLFGLAIAMLGVVVLMPHLPGPNDAAASEDAATRAEGAETVGPGDFVATPSPQRGARRWPYGPVEDDGPAEGPSAEEAEVTEGSEHEFDGLQIDTASPVDSPGDGLGDGFASTSGGGDSSATPFSLSGLGW